MNVYLLPGDEKAGKVVGIIQEIRAKSEHDTEEINLDILVHLLYSLPGCP